ncbi:MAG: GIY-YIG nuclease family protein [Pseudomonadota bacterium]
MYKVYVLSDNNGKIYKGMTSNLDRRLKEHSSGRTKTTRSFKNIKLVYFEEFPNRIEARKREKYFKSAAGRKFLKNKLSGPGSSVG